MHLLPIRTSNRWRRTAGILADPSGVARRGRTATSLRSLIKAVVASCLCALLGLAGTAEAAVSVYHPPGTVGNAPPPSPITEFSAGISPGSGPFGIAAGPDGNMWFTESLGNRIGRITPTGVVSEFSAGITPRSDPNDQSPYGIAAGPDGNMWFTEPQANRIGRITPSGVVTEFSAGISPNSGPVGIAAGPDGNMWFAEISGKRIGRITPSGVVTEFSSGITQAPQWIAAGPDGNMWFTEPGLPDRIGRITTRSTVCPYPRSPSCHPQPAGTVTEFSAGITGRDAEQIAAGPDGNMWFAEMSGQIGRITPTGVVTEFSAASAGVDVSPHGIAAGRDGNLWFTDDNGRVGRITPAGAVTLYGVGNTSPVGIVAGPDGNMWFADCHGFIGRIDLSLT